MRPRHLAAQGVGREAGTAGVREWSSVTRPRVAGPHMWVVGACPSMADAGLPPLHHTHRWQTWAVAMAAQQCSWRSSCTARQWASTSRPSRCVSWLVWTSRAVCSADGGCRLVLLDWLLNCCSLVCTQTPQVQAANSLAARTGFTPADVHFVVGDALAPTLPPASFDLVLAVESSAYMPDKE